MSASDYAAGGGEGYERQMGRWSRRLAEPFLDFAGCRDDDRVLDLGCGTGALAAAVLARTRSGEVFGLDIAPAYVEHARRRCPGPRATFAVGDAMAPDVPAGAFDRVLALLLLHFLPGPGAALAAMRRAARPGGTIAAAVWDNRGGFVAQRMFWDTAAALLPSAVAQRARHCTRPLTRPDELGAAFVEAGLREVRTTALVVRMDFDGFEDWWAPCEGRDGPVAAWVGTLSADERDLLQEAARAAYLDGAPDGPRSYAALAWAARGVA